MHQRTSVAYLVTIVVRVYFSCQKEVVVFHQGIESEDISSINSSQHSIMNRTVDQMAVPICSWEIT